MGEQTAATILTMALRRYLNHPSNLSASDRSFTATCTSCRTDTNDSRSNVILVTFVESEQEASLILLAIFVVSETSYLKLCWDLDASSSHLNVSSMCWAIRDAYRTWNWRILSIVFEHCRASSFKLPRYNLSCRSRLSGLLELILQTRHCH